MERQTDIYRGTEGQIGRGTIGERKSDLWLPIVLRLSELNSWELKESKSKINLY